MAEKKYAGIDAITQLIALIRASFSPKNHTHTKSDITDFPSIPTKVGDLVNDKSYSSVTMKTWTSSDVPK